MSADPVPLSQIDVNKLELRKPKKENLKNATGKTYHVFHDGVKLKVVLPEMTAPFGAGSSEKFPNKYTMSLSFQGCNKALEKMKAIDDKILDLILAQKAEVFAKDAKDKKKAVSLDVLKARYKSFIVPGDESKKYADRISLSIQTRKAPEGTSDEERAAIEKEFTTMGGDALLVTPDGTKIHVNTENIREKIPYGSRVRAVAEFAYLWVLGSSQECYPVWTFVLGKLVSTLPVSTFNILNVEDDEEDDAAAAINKISGPAETDEDRVLLPVVDEEEAHLAAAAL